MPVRVHGMVAPLAVGAAGLDHAVGMITERRRLAAAHVQPDVPAIVVDELAVFVEFADLFELDEHLVV